VALDHDGDVEYVQGSGKKPYTLKNVGGVMSCDCMAWRNQSKPIDKRTCKHLKSIRGAAVEDARTNGAAIQQVGITSGRVQTAVPNQANAPRSGLTSPGCACERGSTCDVAHDPATCPCAMCSGQGVSKEERIRLMEKAVGRKLRPDEKTKLNGPPVLLAHPWDGDRDPSGWYWSTKLDGCRGYWTGSEFVSRQGNVFHAPDWFKAGLPDHPLDGELWMGRQSFQRTMSVVRSIDAGERWKDVLFVVFDVPNLAKPFEDRIQFLEDWYKTTKPAFAAVHSHGRVRDREHLRKLLDLHTSKGDEGIMIRKPGSFYEAGRSHTLLKVKKFFDAEAVVIGHEPGKGRHSGVLGGLMVRMSNGKEFRLGTGLSDAERRSPPPVGSLVTYTFTETTEAGIPKCAAFLRVRPSE
jgi:DNA ligase-1